ncbi:MAG: hypothetical protein JWO89_2195 [Verrucomicrobiaceae bacterium]|nr:hypothetical protein [Verrucomicrobiaceae bacterium]
MTEVAIQLPDELDQFVRRSVNSGAYHDADEFFVSVLSNFKELIEAPLAEAEQTKLADLRRDVQHAADQLDRGEGVANLDWDAFLAERHRAHATRKPL